MSNTIFLIVGESGSGKTTIVTALEKQYGMKSIQSYTTRPKRFEFEKGHIFVNDEEFNQLQNICAYTEFNNYRYCATSEQIDCNDLYVIDPKGVEYFKGNYKGNKRVIVIYIASEKVDRFLRMKKRGDSTQDALDRTKNDEIEFANAPAIANHIVMNNRILEEVVENVYSIIKDYEE